MKNIQSQYIDLKEGKISEVNFLTNVRRLFPDYIGTANNLEDAVNILKGKRILSEGMQRLTEDKMYYLVDEHGDVVDQIEAPDMIAARNHFENEFEGLMTSMTIVPSHPRAMYETEQSGLIVVGKTQLDNNAIADMLDNGGFHGEWNPREGYWFFPEGEETYDSLEAALEKEFNSRGIDARFEGIFESRKKTALNEVEEKSEGSYKNVTGKKQYEVFSEIDRVNPYEFKKGLQIEMGMQYLPTPNYFTTHFNPDTVVKATKKVLKNLQKDPAYYTNNISLEFEKKSGLLQKPKEVKVQADGGAKVKGFTDAKSNTETNLGKREKSSKSPDGVKEMKPSKKSMGGIKIMKTNGKVPKGVELMKESAKAADKQIVDQAQSTPQISSMSKLEAKKDKMHKLKEYLKAEVRRVLKEEDPALAKLDQEEEKAEKALATVLTKRAAILNKPGTQG